jgi:hypothetical protein
VASLKIARLPCVIEGNTALTRSVQMFAAKPILAAALAIGLAYAAYPYVTLYRLDAALHTGDATTLRALVDWPAVREGIKEDICDNVADAPDATNSDGKLPAFGASFVRGITVNTVDHQVTAEGLVGMTHHHATSMATGNGVMQVNWAFFHDPTSFIVSVDAAGQPVPIRLQLSLKDATWQVTRIWLPPALLSQANPPTS